MNSMKDRALYVDLNALFVTGTAPVQIAASTPEAIYVYRSRRYFPVRRI